MQLAIEVARRGLLAGEPPIGACLVKDDEVIATLSNAVIGELDITAHAEMRVIRAACRELRTLELTGCRMFVTVEPCPMCLSACHYAQITEIVYGASLAELNALTGNEHMTSQAHGESSAGRSPTIGLTGGCLGDECRSLLGEWVRRVEGVSRA
jgi:guanine deaminase